MTFGQLISAAGHDKKKFAKLSCIELQLFDGKNYLINEELRFARPLFCDNPVSERKFYEFLLKKESEDIVLPESLQGRLTADALILYWPNRKAEFFFRFI